MTVLLLLVTFRPQEGSELLVEVDELLDETLAEIGPVDGHNTQRLDSEEYNTSLERRMKERRMNRFQFAGGPDMPS